MIKNASPEIQAALTLLWEYADDALISGRTKEECELAGFECKGEMAHYVVFILLQEPLTPAQDSDTLQPE